MRVDLQPTYYEQWHDIDLHGAFNSYSPEDVAEAMRNGKAVVFVEHGDFKDIFIGEAGLIYDTVIPDVAAKVFDTMTPTEEQKDAIWKNFRIATFCPMFFDEEMQRLKGRIRCYLNVYHTTLELVGDEEGQYWEPINRPVAAIPITYGMDVVSEIHRLMKAFPSDPRTMGALDHGGTYNILEEPTAPPFR